MGIESEPQFIEQELPFGESISDSPKRSLIGSRARHDDFSTLPELKPKGTFDPEGRSAEGARIAEEGMINDQRILQGIARQIPDHRHRK